MRLFRHQASSTLIDMMVNLERVSKNEAKRLRAAADRVQIVERRLGWRRIQGGVISSGRQSSGVFKDGKLVPGTRLHRQNAGEPIPPNDLDVKFIDKDVLFIGVFNTCWGHCITDSLKHLWFVLKKIPDEYQFLPKVYCTLAVGERLPRNLLEMLSLLGIDLQSAARVDNATRFRSVVVPDECFFTLEKPEPEIRCATPEYGAIIDFLINAAGVRDTPSNSRKIYFSTSCFKSWDYGSGSLDKSFLAAGFEVVHPEELSFVEMLRLLGEASVFASTEGSCAHNSVFLRKGTRVIILRKLREMYWHQLAINRIRELSVTYVDSFISSRLLMYDVNAPKSGPFFVWTNRWLASLLSIRSKFPLIDFVKYVSFGMTLHFGHMFGEWRRESFKEVKE